jgi:RND family efflux transporter MFP subunit
MKMQLRQAMLVYGLLTLSPNFAQASAQPVRTMTVVESVSVPEQQIPGRVEAIHTVELRSRIEGTLTHVHFRDGQYVSQGDLLFQIDDAEYLVALELAKAERVSAEATFLQSQQLLNRFQSLIATNAVSRNDVDNVRMQRDVAAASLKQAKARVKARQITLDYTRITAPVSGRIGHSAVHVGNVVTPASGVLVDLVQLDPVRVAFAVEESRFHEKTRRHPDIAELKNALIAEIGPSDNRQAGTLTSIDNRIDPRTASITLRAEFANTQHHLLPGASIDVYLRSHEEQRVVMLPVSAVLKDMQGFYAWVIDDAEQAQSRRLTLDGQQGQAFRVTAGLNEGDRIVTEGTQRLRDGMAVRLLD